MISNTRVLGSGEGYRESLSVSLDFYVSDGRGSTVRGPPGVGDAAGFCSYKNYRIIKILLTLRCVMHYNCFVDNYYPGEFYKKLFEGGLR